MEYAWIIWLIVAAVFAAAEVFTAGFFMLWFSVGALVAAALALLGVGSPAVQMFVFLLVSAALVVASRTIFERFLTRRPDDDQQRTGVETMIGQLGTVVEASSGARHQGAVQVYGSVWTAFPADGEGPLKEGDAVAVERIDGNLIYVRRGSRPAPYFGKNSDSS